MHDFIVPFGPQHPAEKEPMCIRAGLEGETITELDLRFGYVHRGMEKIFEGKGIDQGIYLCERICGLCSESHSMAFTRTIEEMLGLDVPMRVRHLRSIVTELSRLHSHMIWAGFMAHEAGYETLFMYLMRERERIMDILERTTGGRVHYGINKIGTLRYDVPNAKLAKMVEDVDTTLKNIEKYVDTFRNDGTLKERLVGTGMITGIQAKRFGIVGPVARGCGINNDVRKSDPYAAYDLADFEVPTYKGCDAWSRTMVRLEELYESGKIIRQLIKDIPDEKIPAFKFTKADDGDHFARIEAPRGELFYYLKVRDSKIDRLAIRTPSMAVLPMVLKPALMGEKVSDLPIVISSLDPCFSCMERVVIVEKGKEKVYTEPDFRRKFSGR